VTLTFDIEEELMARALSRPQFNFNIRKVTGTSYFLITTKPGEFLNVMKMSNFVALLAIQQKPLLYIPVDWNALLMSRVRDFDEETQPAAYLLTGIPRTTPTYITPDTVFIKESH